MKEKEKERERAREISDVTDVEKTRVTVSTFQASSEGWRRVDVDGIGGVLEKK